MTANQLRRQAEHRRKERVVLHAHDALNLAQAVAHRVRVLKQRLGGGRNLHVLLDVNQRRLFQIGVVLRVVFADGGEHPTAAVADEGVFAHREQIGVEPQLMRAERRLSAELRRPRGIHRLAHRRAELRACTVNS